MQNAGIVGGSSSFCLKDQQPEISQTQEQSFPNKTIQFLPAFYLN
jgi:hypothetical protein